MRRRARNGAIGTGPVGRRGAPGLPGAAGLLCLPCLLGALGLLACGESTEPVADPPAPQLPPAEAQAPVDPDACPEGTRAVRREIAAADSVLQWCEKRSESGRAVQHGPWRREVAGLLVERGRYREGRRDGKWVFYWSSGERQSEGAFQEGAKVGPWRFFRRNGEEMRVVDYSAPAPATRETPPAPAAPARAGGVQLLVRNGDAEARQLRVEPFGEELSLAPGASVRVSASGPGASELVLETTREGLLLEAPGSAVVKLGEPESAR